MALQYPLSELRASAYAGMNAVERKEFEPIRQERRVRLFAFHRPRYRKADWCLSREAAEAQWLHERDPSVLQRLTVEGVDILALRKDGDVMTVGLIPRPYSNPHCEAVVPGTFRVSP